MATMHFKTNAKCAGCVARIGEELDKHMAHEQWSIDLSTPERTLTVEGDCAAGDVVQWVSAAGFKAEPLS
ncbi:MAG: heavy-metal-associated domain-containing protein [Bacteroidaceae bacterium]|jgi:copper chaperone